MNGLVIRAEMEDFVGPFGRNLDGFTITVVSSHDDFFVKMLVDLRFTVHSVFDVFMSIQPLLETSI